LASRVTRAHTHTHRDCHTHARARAHTHTHTHTNTHIRVHRPSSSSTPSLQTSTTPPPPPRRVPARSTPPATAAPAGGCWPPPLPTQRARRRRRRGRRGAGPVSTGLPSWQRSRRGHPVSDRHGSTVSLHRWCRPQLCARAGRRARACNCPVCSTGPCYGLMCSIRPCHGYCIGARLRTALEAGQRQRPFESYPSRFRVVSESCSTHIRVMFTDFRVIRVLSEPCPPTHPSHFRAISVSYPSHPGHVA
jgi:hypothetical protein